MKKKVNIFGKKISVFVIALFAVALVSAALVTYLSGTVIGEVEVKSPMVTGISLGLPSWSTTQCLNTDPDDSKFGEMVDCFPEGVESDGTTIIKDWEESNWEKTEAPLHLDDMYTGQEKTFTLYTMSENIAGVEIIGYEEAIVTNPLGVTCADFESVVVRTDSIYGGLGYGRENNALEICVQNGPNKVKFDSKGVGALSKWGAGETDVSEMVVTFNNVIGTYTFTYRVIPVA